MIINDIPLGRLKEILASDVPLTIVTTEALIARLEQAEQEAKAANGVITQHVAERSLETHRNVGIAVDEAVNTPLNPDALAHARSAAFDCWENGGNMDDLAECAIEAYLAVAQPVVTGEQINRAGWTCDGIHEPGSYATCEDCRGACDDLANFYNNMMQQPKADGPWTYRPEVKP